MLKQDLTVLRRFLSFPSVEIQDCVLATHSLHSQFACIEISVEAGRMSQAGENVGIMDINKKL